MIRLNVDGREMVAVPVVAVRPLLGPLLQALDAARRRDGWSRPSEEVLELLAIFKQVAAEAERSPRAAGVPLPGIPAEQGSEPAGTPVDGVDVIVTSMSVEAATVQLGVSAERVRAMCRFGQLDAVKTASGWRITADSVADRRSARRVTDPFTFT